MQLQQVMLNLIINAIEAMQAVQGSPEGVAHQVDNGFQGRKRFGRRQRRRAESGRPGPYLSSFLHDQARWDWNGTVDQPFDH